MLDFFLKQHLDPFSSKNKLEHQILSDMFNFLQVILQIVYFLSISDLSVKLSFTCQAFIYLLHGIVKNKQRSFFFIFFSFALLILLFYGYVF